MRVNRNGTIGVRREIDYIIAHSETAKSEVGKVDIMKEKKKRNKIDENNKETERESIG